MNLAFWKSKENVLQEITEIVFLRSNLSHFSIHYVIYNKCHLYTNNSNNNLNKIRHVTNYKASIVPKRHFVTGTSNEGNFFSTAISALRHKSLVCTSTWPQGQSFSNIVAVRFIVEHWKLRSWTTIIWLCSLLLPEGLADNSECFDSCVRRLGEWIEVDRGFAGNRTDRSDSRSRWSALREVPAIKWTVTTKRNERSRAFLRWNYRLPPSRLGLIASNSKQNIYKLINIFQNCNERLTYILHVDS